MNKLDKEIEQQLRKYYTQELGDAPSFSTLVAKLPKQLPDQARTDMQSTQRKLLFFLPTSGTTNQRTQFRRAIAIACSFLLALTIITSTVYAANSSIVQTVFAYLFNKQEASRFVDINQTQTIGGAKVSVIQAYADEKNIYIVYDIQYPNLTNQKKMTVANLDLKEANGASFQVQTIHLPPVNKLDTRPLLATFDTSKLTKDQQTLKLHLVVNLQFSAGQVSEKGTATFDFEIPRHIGSKANL